MHMPVVRRVLAASAVLLTAAAATPAVAQNVIDQQQPAVLQSYFSINIWNAQTFVPTATNISGVGAFLLPNSVGQGMTGSVTLALWSGSPFLQASQQLASQTVSYNTGSGGAWADAFWSPVGVTPGRTYWLLIGAIDGGSGTTLSAIGSSGSYAKGTAYINYSTDVRARPYQDMGDDLTFRTYTSVGVTATPEPGTWALLGTGLFAMGGLAARRRRDSTV